MTMTDHDNAGKLFVGGLSWETTKENLQTYFCKFGEVVDCTVVKNSETGRSRGFGFVTFKDPSCVSTVLECKPHEINGRTIDAKECTPRGMQKGKRTSAPFKVFMGGLPPDITESAIRDALSQFGKVTQVLIMVDQQTKKCRGFGFLSFESEDSIDRVCAERYVNINDKKIECKRAEPRDSPLRSASHPYSMHPHSQNGPGPGPIRHSMYMPMTSSAYQSNWTMNMPVQGNSQESGGYGNYQNYDASSGMPYIPSATSYSSMQQPQTPQYMQSYYSNYGAAGDYNYAQAPANNGSMQSATSAAVPNYSQASAVPSNYAQHTAAIPPTFSQNSAGLPSFIQPSVASSSLKGPDLSSSSFSASSYSQASSGYGPSKPYLGAHAAMQNLGGTGASNTAATSLKNQTYHPYKR